jgi:hypothetical protein
MRATRKKIKNLITRPSKRLILLAANQANTLAMSADISGAVARGRLAIMTLTTASKLCLALLAMSIGQARAACNTDSAGCSGWVNFSNGHLNGRTYYEIHYADGRVIPFSLGGFEKRRVEGLHTGDKYCQADYPFGKRLTPNGPPISCDLRGILVSH